MVSISLRASASFGALRTWGFPACVGGAPVTAYLGQVEPGFNKVELRFVSVVVVRDVAIGNVDPLDSNFFLVQQLGGGESRAEYPVSGRRASVRAP